MYNVPKPPTSNRDSWLNLTSTRDGWFEMNVIVARRFDNDFSDNGFVANSGDRYGIAYVGSRSIRFSAAFVTLSTNIFVLPGETETPFDKQQQQHVSTQTFFIRRERAIIIIARYARYGETTIKRIKN